MEQTLLNRPGIYSARASAIHALHDELGDIWENSVIAEWQQQQQQQRPVLQTAVQISALDKQYQQRQVLQQLDLAIGQGEFVAIIGRSGCGKSTLLRLLAQLEQPDGGTIAYPSASEPQLRVMFQDARLLPWKTVLHNVTLGLPCGLASQQQARQVLRDVGLLERANDWPAQLSGGQRQRVALARALLHQPDLLLLDEPLGALDALTRLEMQNLIEQVWLKRGFSAVLVTHDVHEAVRLADRIVLIEQGRVAQQWTVALARPRAAQNPWLAQLEAEIVRRVLRQPDSAAAHATNADWDWLKHAVSFNFAV